jgi:CubicO group peptidase (beta-lactamase class C family)
MRPASLLFAALCAAAPLNAQRSIPSAQWKAFTERFNAYADSDRIVGASVAFVSGSRVIAHHEHGFADKAKGVPITERSIYHWGSITKTLTGIGIMQLRDRGRLSLDDPIVKYVPELRRIYNPFGAIDSVTIRMLMSHSAGFRNGTWPYGNDEPWEPFEPTEWSQLVAMMPYQRVMFKPGSRYSYSNPGYIYLGRTIEFLTGDPWETYIQKNIFSPLGLASSYFGVTPYYLAADRPHNYYARRDSASGRDTLIDNGTDFDPGITIPNGGWNAPLSDLAKYVAFLGAVMRGDSAWNARYEVVLPRKDFVEMWTPRLSAVPQPNPGTASDSIGLTYFTMQRRGARFIGHTGGQAGYTAFFYVNRETGDAVVAAFNTQRSGGSGSKRGAFPAIIDAALELIR